MGPLSRRQFLRHSVASAGGLLLLTACGQAAPASAPAGATSASATAPAATSPTTAPAAASNQQQLVIAVPGEPETGLIPRDASSFLTNFVVFNVYNYLTQRNPDGSIVGQLAESFSRTADKTWRFVLRKGVTFSNGEAFNADTVLTAVEHEFAPGANGRAKGDYPTVAYPAVKVDDYTVDINTTDPDPILPTKIIRFKMPAPNWLKTTPDTTLATTAVGSGPYTLVEWIKGDHLLLRANPTYWGPNKPKIPEVKIVGRADASVRASMVQAGEAQIAYTIPPEQASQVPRSVVEKTTEVEGIRMNTDHPLLKDERARQALILSLDTQLLMSSLYSGFSSPVNGQMIRPSALGFNTSLQPYPHDPDMASKLIQQLGAAGTSLQITIQQNMFANVSQLGEAISNSMSATGLNVTPTIKEAAQWREDLFAVQQGQPRSDMLMTSASNPIFDSIRVMGSYYPCGGQFSQWCDPDFTSKLNTAATLTGDQRASAFQDLWAYAYNHYAFIPLFGLDFIHGVSPKLSWTPRDDGFEYFSDMELAS